MISHAIVSFAFRLINFAILIGVFWYIYKKYVQASIAESIAQEMQQEAEWRERVAQLNHESKDIERQIQKDAQECAALRDRIMQWKKIVERKNDQVHTQRLAHIERVRELSQLKSEKISQYRMHKKLVPLVLAQLRTSLQQKFAAQQHGAGYIDASLKKIEDAQ